MSLVAAEAIDLRATPSEFQLTLSEPATREINVTLLLRGTALPGRDYTAPDGLNANNNLIVTFPAGSDTATLTLPTLADEMIDPGEVILAMNNAKPPFNDIRVRRAVSDDTRLRSANDDRETARR